MFNDYEDMITLIKKDGRRIENIAATVQPKTIFIRDDWVPVEEEDILERILPNGLVEQFEVVERGYYGQSSGFSAYQTKVRKLTSPRNEPHAQHIHLLGANTRVNIDSTDSSVNISLENPTFDGLQSVIHSSFADIELKEKVQSILAKMKIESDAAAYIQEYKALIHLCEQHILIIARYIPMLTMRLP